MCIVPIIGLQCTHLKLGSGEVGAVGPGVYAGTSRADKVADSCCIWDARTVMVCNGLSLCRLSAILDPYLSRLYCDRCGWNSNAAP